MCCGTYLTNFSTTREGQRWTNKTKVGSDHAGDKWARALGLSSCYIHEHVINQLVFSELVYNRNINSWHRVCGHGSRNQNLTGNPFKAEDDGYPHIWGTIHLWK